MNNTFFFSVLHHKDGASNHLSGVFETDPAAAPDTIPEAIRDFLAEQLLCEPNDLALVCLSLLPPAVEGTSDA